MTGQWHHSFHLTALAHVSYGRRYYPFSRPLSSVASISSPSLHPAPYPTAAPVHVPAASASPSILPAAHRSRFLAGHLRSTSTCVEREIKGDATWILTGCRGHPPLDCWTATFPSLPATIAPLLWVDIVSVSHGPLAFVNLRSRALSRPSTSQPLRAGRFATRSLFGRFSPPDHRRKHSALGALDRHHSASLPDAHDTRGVRPPKTRPAVLSQLRQWQPYPVSW